MMVLVADHEETQREKEHVGKTGKQVSCVWWLSCVPGAHQTHLGSRISDRRQKPHISWAWLTTPFWGQGDWQNPSGHDNNGYSVHPTQQPAGPHEVPVILLFHRDLNVTCFTSMLYCRFCMSTSSTVPCLVWSLSFEQDTHVEHLHFSWFTMISILSACYYN